MLAQDRAAVRHYIEETGLPFDILIDERRELSRAYGVWHRVGLDAWNIARPAVFLIEPDGRISYAFVSGNQREYPSPQDLVGIADETLRLPADNR